jgi:hypothetical protein
MIMAASRGESEEEKTKYIQEAKDLKDEKD